MSLHSKKTRVEKSASGSFDLICRVRVRVPEISDYRTATENSTSTQKIYFFLLRRRERKKEKKKKRKKKNKYSKIIATDVQEIEIIENLHCQRLSIYFFSYFWNSASLVLFLTVSNAALGAYDTS